MTDDNNDQAQDWRSALPEEIRDNPSLADVKTIEDLAKTHINAQSMLGNSIRVPGPEAGDDARKEFYDKILDKAPGLMPSPNPEDQEAQAALWKKLGRPEDSAAYEMPEGITGLDELRDYAHSAGLTKKQFQELAKVMGENLISRNEGKERDFNESIKGLKREWGVTYEDRMDEVKNILHQTGAPSELQEAFTDKKIDSDTIQWLHGIARAMVGEQINFNKDEDSGSSRITPAEAESRIAEIMGDRDGPYWDPSDPRHEEFKQKVIEYGRAANGGR